jgi:cellulose synthase (UDP-forming)
MFTGLGAPAGTLVNIAWVVFDLLILSVIIRAALYKGFSPAEDVEEEPLQRAETRTGLVPGA